MLDFLQITPFESGPRELVAVVVETVPADLGDAARLARTGRIGTVDEPHLRHRLAHDRTNSGTDVTAIFVDYLKPMLGSDMPEAHRLEAPTVAKVV